MNNLKVAFFTEAGSKRGLGHLIRCNTIHSKFKSLGADSFFFLDSDIDFNYKFDDIHYFKWEEFKINGLYDIIFIDSYEADIDIYNTIAQSCKIAVYLDDYKRLPYPKGIILNFSPDADERFYKEKDKMHTYLLGLEHIPIRDEFLDLSPTKQEQIFIMLGGSDTANLSIKICESLQNTPMQKVIVTNNEDDIATLNSLNNTKVLFKPSDKELIAAMGNSSMAISTASMTLYELAFLRIPTIIISVANNQEIGAEALVDHGLANKSLSIKNSNWLDDLQVSITNLNSITSTIDGQGTQRIVNKTLEQLK